MRHNYLRIIDAFLGFLFGLMILGLAFSIIYLDYAMGYYGQDQEFANLLINCDKFLIGFTAGSVLCCILYAVFDIFDLPHAKFLQLLMAFILLGISTYLFILMAGLRNQAFSLNGYSTSAAFSLYKEYRIISILIITPQFLLSLQALIRLFLSKGMFHRKPDENEEE